jgi:regulator of sirC expression with transglutaminase-like and TPR domain
MPECDELLGHIYAKRGEFVSAARHYRAFVDARPEAPSSANLRSRLAEWADLGVIQGEESNP